MATTCKPPRARGSNGPDSAPAVRPYAERAAAGLALRGNVPRKAHDAWRKHATRDPIAVLERSNGGRLPELVPLRFGRMLQSPFAFLRGSAAVMASDLAQTPNTSIAVQLCGDCHLLNFGLFATPERRLVFDLNDFDETLPGPWEWDVKRLVASFVVAAREFGLTDAQAREVVLRCVGTYCRRIREFSLLDSTGALVFANRLGHHSRGSAKRENTQAERAGRRARPKARHRTPVPEDHHGAGRGGYRFVDQPPLLFHVPDPAGVARVNRALSAYRDTLSPTTGASSSTATVCRTSP